MALIVGMAGGSASGKSSFLTDLKETLTDKISILSLDDYYKPIEEQREDQNGVVNFDTPTSIDREKFSTDLLQLLQGNDIEIPQYEFNNPDVSATTIKTIKATKILVVEGLFVFHFEEIRKHFGLSLFIEADESVRYNRRMQRDRKERGISKEMIEYQWQNHVIPAYKEYLLPVRRNADLVINNNVSYKKALDVLCTYFLSRIS